MKIDENYQFSFNQMNFKASLKGMVFCENNNHFTLAYLQPPLENFGGSNWTYYNDMSSSIIEYNSINFGMNAFIESNRLPIILIYKIDKFPH